MLRISAGKSRRGMSIVWLNEYVGWSKSGIIHIPLEVVKVPETTFKQVCIHAANSQGLRESITFVDCPGQTLIVRPGIDGAIIKFIAVVEDRTRNIKCGWTIIQAA